MQPEVRSWTRRAGGALRPAGWYADPSRLADARYWNGETWTEGRGGGDGAALAIERLLAAPGGTRLRGSTGRLAAVTICGLALAFGFAIGLVELDRAISRPGGLLPELVISELGLWSGLFGTCVYVSRHWGTRRLRADFDLRVRGVDAAIGVLGALGACSVAAAFVFPIMRVHKITGNPDQAVYGAINGSATAWIVVVLLTCIGAPFFEELFFRGLVQRQLVQRYGPVVGIALTAMTFGAAHIANDPAVNGLIYAASITGAGIVLGVVRHLAGRLGASMASHCFFNGIALVALAVTLH